MGGSIHFSGYKPTGISVVLLLCLTFFYSCGSGRTGRDFTSLQQLVEQKEFEVVHQWAMPLGGSRVNLIGNANFIRFTKDSVDLFLPYFGVRHTGGGYGSEGGILYKGPLREFQINQREERIILKFEGNHRSENLQFIITLFPNHNAATSVISSQRNAISYQGEVREFPEEIKK